MSDIYLQITETPTVVTLSAPVISGALSSTVTVANTVTVALDSNSLSALENVTVTVGAAITGTVTVSNFPTSQAVTFSAVTISNFPATQAVSLASVPTHGVTLASTTVTISSLPAISGTVTANVFGKDYNQIAQPIKTALIGLEDLVDGYRLAVGLANNIGHEFGTDYSNPFLVGGYSIENDATKTLGVTTAGDVRAVLTSALPAGANRIGVVTIGGGTVTIGAGTAQIGSVTASISGTVPISISSVTVGNSVTIGSLPAISGTVTANTFALQGTAVTTSNFTSTTASTVLANYNATREVLTIFNEGAGNLHICAGATCTTIAYQVRLSAGDYYEVPNHQTTITHSAVFATAGTARVTQIS
jgi:hypothetical protein